MLISVEYDYSMEKLQWFLYALSIIEMGKQQENKENYVYSEAVQSIA